MRATYKRSTPYIKGRTRFCGCEELHPPHETDRFNTGRGWRSSFIVTNCPGKGEWEEILHTLDMESYSLSPKGGSYIIIKYNDGYEEEIPCVRYRADSKSEWVYLTSGDPVDDTAGMLRYFIDGLT